MKLNDWLAEEQTQALGHTGPYIESLISTPGASLIYKIQVLIAH